MTTHRYLTFAEVGADRWDQFVRQHPHHAPGHLAATLRLEAQHGARPDAAFAMVDEADRLVAVCPLVDTQRKTARLFTTRVRSSGTWFPSAPLVDMTRGERVAIELLKEVADRALTAARADGMDDLLMSYPAVAGAAPAIDVLGFCPLRRFGATDHSRLTMLLSLDPSEEQLFKALDPKARNKIRRAEALGCTVEQIADAAAWRACYPLYAETLGDEAISREAFDAIFDASIATRDAVAIRVMHEGQVVNVVVITLVNQAAYYWLGFNDRAKAPAGANVLGLWTGIREARARGMRIFELGSLDFDENKHGRIAAFKQQFGGRTYVAFGGQWGLSPVREHLLALGLHVIRRLRRVGAR